ncbi:MAG: hypothetical protein AAFY56_12490 [Pseudomonadota bacterium]
MVLSGYSTTSEHDSQRLAIPVHIFETGGLNIHKNNRSLGGEEYWEFRVFPKDQGPDFSIPDTRSHFAGANKPKRKPRGAPLYAVASRISHGMSMPAEEPEC